jgi:hypothetical protein
MTDRTLTDLLERTGDRTEVGPPPLDAMLRGVRRRRRRHATVAGVALGVATVAVAVLVPVLATPGRDDPTTIPQPAQSDTVSPPSGHISIEGRWIVVALPGWDGRLTRGRHRHVQIRFHDGRLRANDGLNTTSGRYVLRADRFHLKGHLITSAVGSTRPIPPLAARLHAVRSVSRDQGGTYLEDGHGHVVIALWRR